jgi:hypothetical protein
LKDLLLGVRPGYGFIRAVETTWKTEMDEIAEADINGFM